MGDLNKKQFKKQAKIAKKTAKGQQKTAKSAVPATIPENDRPTPQPADDASKTVKFAEAVRGLLFMIFALSLTVAIFLNQKGYTVTTSDIIQTLIDTLPGKFILSVIAAAFFIYGLKCLRAIK